MKIKFAGADRTVTGSKHLVKTNNKQILLDCGMVLGDLKRNYKLNTDFLFDPKKVDCVVLSHAHLDHCGLLPVLVKQGFKGKIYCTNATKELTEVLLMDSAKIQFQDVDHKYRYYGEKIEPLYTEKDVAKVRKHFEVVEYNKWFKLFPNIEIRLVDAGHILGSSIVSLKSKENNRKRVLSFTGDIGRKGLPIIHDPVQIKSSDAFITESTYASHLHDNFNIIYDEMEILINEVYKRGGRILVPTFALERIQEMVYVLHKLYNERQIPEIPIFVDSPLANEISKVFHKNPKYYDKETYDDFLNNLESPFGFRNLHYIQSKEESKALNNYDKPCMIIAASGMAEAGRIVHHLKFGISDPRNLILVVGFMAKGTLGRRIVEHEPKVKIFNKYYRLKADVVVVNAFSAHADKLDLLDYIGNIKNLKHIFVVHGEETETSVMRDNLYNILKFKGKVDVPSYGDEIEVCFE